MKRLATALLIICGTASASDLDEAMRLCQPYMSVKDGNILSIVPGWDKCGQVYSLWYKEQQAKQSTQDKAKARLDEILKGK